VTGTRRSLIALWTAVLATVVATLATTTYLLLTAYQAYTIPSASMSPTLQVGTQVLVDRDAEPQLGDMVVFSASGWGVGDQIGRVIGLGGQTVACCTDGALTRDGAHVREPYLGTAAGNETSFGPVTVPEGRLWLMGDDRAKAADSRSHSKAGADGTVAVDDVVGIVVRHGSTEAVFGYVLARGALVGVPFGVLVLALALALRTRRRPTHAEVAPDHTDDDGDESGLDWDAAWENEGLDLLQPKEASTSEG